MLNIYSKAIFLFLILFKATDSTVLLWGPEQLRFPALQQFTNEHLDELLDQFQSNEFITFETKTLEVANIISTNMQNKTRAYIPSSNLDLGNLNVSELTGNSAVDILTIEKVLNKSNSNSHQNNLIVLLVKEDSNINKIPTKLPDNSILYSASQWDNKPVGAVLSSKPPLFETNFSSINLKEATFSTFDGREDSPCLISSIPTDDGKITLTFKFLWLNDYWHFTSIEGVLVNKYDIKEFVLIPNVDIKALRHFSYRCDGDTIFTDTENGVRLHLFDLQVQPDRLNHKFSRAYDCSRRTKRKVEDEEITTTTEKPYEEPSGSPVLYSAPFPDNKDSEAMVYSSKPPLLRTNSSLINLGEATSAQVDVRDTYTRLIATISVENGKIYLRFKFSWSSGYWYLNSVEVQFIGDIDLKQYNLTINQDISAPKRFSYHCGGQVSLVDSENDVELIIYGIQAQPDAFKHRFSDAYNCIPFTTGPLLSGLFVTFILIIGLVIGLIALDNIKTMDKFDNHKTKQLSITVSE